MWNPLKAYWDHKERMAKIAAEAQAAPFHAMVAAVESQSQILKEWLEGFKSTEIPAPSIVRESDEVRAEQDRERANGLEQTEDRWMAIDAAKLFPDLRH